MVYFNATKQIETLTIHYNSKLDGSFVEEVVTTVKEVAKKMSKVNLKNPREFESIKVFVYPSKQLFYKVFAGEIEKRFYARRRSLEDLYVVQDAGGNIHIVSPRGMAEEKQEAFKKILVMKILGEYMEEKEKQSAEKLLKQSMKPKEKEEKQEDEKEKEHADEQELEQQDEEIELEPEEEGIGEQDEQDVEQEEEELDEEQVDEIIQTEHEMEEIDEEQAQTDTKQEEQDKKKTNRSEAQLWLSAGWFAYIRGKLKKEKDIKRFAENISKNGIKKLGQLSQGKWYESYNYSEEYACAWVECIISTYGMKKFVEYYENPKDIMRIFGVPKFIFESQLKAYIKEKYKDNEKALNVAQDIKLEDIVEPKQEIEKEDAPIFEITALHFAKNGGVDITTDKEIAEPEIQEIV